MQQSINLKMADENFMQLAVKQAKQAALQQEVPVGALLVIDNEIIAQGFNQPISLNDPTAHAEINVLRQAATKLNNYRLLNSTLYVTLEPCLMCAGALINARIKRLVFGAYDEKAGAISSIFNVLDTQRLTHRVKYKGGILINECAGVLQEFFLKRR